MVKSPVRTGAVGGSGHATVPYAERDDSWPAGQKILGELQLLEKLGVSGTVIRLRALLQPPCCKFRVGCDIGLAYTAFILLDVLSLLTVAVN